VISQAALDRLRAFAAGGGKVLFLGRTPGLISGRTILDARAATAADFSWASIEASAQLPETPTPPAYPPPAAPGPQAVAPAILQAVKTAVGRPDVSLASEDTSLRVMKRQLKDSEVYVFFNEGVASTSDTVTFHADGQMVQEWDPATGAVAPEVFTRTRGTLSVQLKLEPYETRVLMVR
jgi:hypothetical protein